MRAVVFRRRPDSEKWSAEEVRKVRGTVGSPNPLHPERDHVPIRMDLEVPETVRAERRPEIMARQVYLKKPDFTKYGYTENCKGCQSIRTDSGSKPHTKTCRERIEKELEKTEEGKQRLQQATDRIWKQAEAVAQEQVDGQNGQDVHQPDGPRIEVPWIIGQGLHTPDGQGGQGLHAPDGQGKEEQEAR